MPQVLGHLFVLFSRLESPSTIRRRNRAKASPISSISAHFVHFGDGKCSFRCRFVDPIERAVSFERSAQHFENFRFLHHGSTHFFSAVICPFLYLPNSIPSSIYWSACDTHIGNSPVASAVCPFNIPVWKEIWRNCLNTSSILV